MPLPYARARRRAVTAPAATLVAVSALVVGLLGPAGARAAPGALGQAQTDVPSESAPAADPRQRQREIEERIRELKNAIGEASAEEAELLAQLGETQTRLDDADAALAAIDGELGVANAALAEAQSELDRLEGRYLTATARLREMERRIDGAEDDVSDLAARMYRRSGGGGSAASLTAFALDTVDPADFLAGTRYLSDAAADSLRRVDELGVLRDDAAELREQLEGQRDEARHARDAVARERARIADLRARQDAARDEIADAVARQETLLGQIRTKQDQFTAEIEALRAESNSIAGMLRDRQVGQNLVAGTGVLGLPVQAPVTSPFGQRRHPILGTTRMHTGIDMGAGYGVTISASADGEVVWAGPRGGYGNTVIIDHGNALATLYAHQSSVAVGVGETVTRGQTVGYVGSTGFSTGPHLHFEVRVRGTPVDPLQYL